MHHPGPLLLTGGPGTGKTEVNVFRTCTHLRQHPERSFLVVAFTRKVIGHLRERFAALLTPDEMKRLHVCTLHALGARILREHGDCLGFKLDIDRRQPKVISDEARHAAVAKTVEQVCQQLRSDGCSDIANLLQAADPREVIRHISTSKQLARWPALDPESHSLKAALDLAYAEHQRLLLSANLIDVDDMILLALKLLREHPEVAQFYQSLYNGGLSYDEFQDTSWLQYELLRRLVPSGPDAMLTVTGDVGQLIYSFRSAVGLEGFAQLQRDFPTIRVMHLRRNRRSSGNIVELGSCFADEADRQEAACSAGAPVALLCAASEHGEVAVITQQIEQATRSGFRYGECAILCRTREPLQAFATALLNAGLPYTVVGSGTFWEQTEVRCVLACLTLSLGDDDHALRQLAASPWRGLPRPLQQIVKGDAPELTMLCVLSGIELATEDQRTLDGFRNWLAALGECRSLPPAQVIDFILADDGAGYRRHLQTAPDGAARTERVSNLHRLASEHTSIGTFLDEVAMMSGQDPLSNLGREHVQIMSLHDAKGLEFDAVFLAGVENGLIPHRAAQSSKAALEEELRLFRVGITRARQVLVMTYCRTRNGSPVDSSQFLRLRELPRRLFARSVDWSNARTGNDGRMTDLAVSRPPSFVSAIEVTA